MGKVRLAGVPALVAAAVLVTLVWHPGGVAAHTSAIPGVGSNHPVRVATSATVKEKQTSLGSVLVNSKGLTLYHLVQENTGDFACTGSCLSTWPPAVLPKSASTPKAGTGVKDKLGFIKRKGIGRQLTYDGWPLYTFSLDTAPGQTNGQGVDNIWFVVPPAPMVNLTVGITSTGPTVWGSVSMSYTYHKKKFSSTCSQSSCEAVAVHAGSTVNLHESATDSATWPFDSWSLSAQNAGVFKTKKTTATTLQAKDDYSIRAIYDDNSSPPPATPKPTTNPTPAPTYCYYC